MTLRLVPGGAETPADQAARWAVRLDRGDLEPAEQAAFDSWLGEPANRSAFDSTQDMLGLFDLSEADVPGMAALREEARRYQAETKRSWMPWAGGAIAASLAALAILLQPIAREDRASDAPQVAQTAPAPASAAATRPLRFVTAVGEQRSVVLADGSKVSLNTGTAIEVAYGPEERVVRLVRGQALFDVAHAPQRPFSVIVAGRKVTALGTLFEVRVDASRLRVTLLRGRVRVDEETGKSEGQGVSATPRAPTFLSPGEQFSAVGTLAPVVQSVDVGQQLLWRQSLVEFDDEPIAGAIAELNRYSSTPIVAADSRVAAMRISGVVRTGDPADFTALVGAMLPVHARKNARGEIELHYAP